MAFNRRSTAEQVSEGIDLSGKNALVTGANTGLGIETTRVLALRGANVTMACRNADRAKTAREKIISESGGAIKPEQLDILLLDLNKLERVREAAEKYNQWGRPLHLLINNAGIMIPMERRTEDGFEAHFGINHLGHFLFTNLLLERLKAANGARVVMVSSAAMAMATLDENFADLNWKERPFKGFASYGDSKLMNLMFAKEFTRRHQRDHIVANALHPGIIPTELGRDQNLLGMLLGIFALPFMRSVKQGAASTVYAATAPEYADKGGVYFINCAEREPEYKFAMNEQACTKLWAVSEELVGIVSV